MHIDMEDTGVEASVVASFVKFKKKNRKHYKSPSEERFRLDTFEKNLRKIKENNLKKNKTFKSAVNKFSDLTFDEFAAKVLNHMIPKNDSLENVQTVTGRLLEQDDTLPTVVDWTKKNGAVAPVRNQKSCGSCWAFSAASAVENALWRHGDKLSVRLSEQELVDCSTPQGNGGCNGGVMIYAFDYIMQNGLGTSFNYFYRAKDMQCKASRTKRNPRYYISDYKLIDPPSVMGLQRAIHEGVTTVYFEVRDDFQFYSEGIYTPSEPGCGDKLNHGMTAVGYNLDSDTPYFKIRNSWGKDWGIKGNAHVAWGTGEGTCGLAYKYASIPVIN